MPFAKVYIHFVWTTKNRKQFLHSKELRETMWKHIRENAKKKGIFVDSVNGYSEHCHFMISMGTDQTIKGVMQLIKGESSFWFNKQKLIEPKFEWQNDYFAVSVSDSMITKVRAYIKNQESHHCKKLFKDEFDEFIDKYGFQKIED